MIKKLEIQNVKGIRHIAIHAMPVNEIAGHNGAGKSTILDSIAFALAGRDFVDREALRAGEDHGFIAIDTDDLRIERHFDKDDQKGKLIVKTNGKNKLTQSNIDTMINTATFDPLAFARASGKEKIELAKKILTDEQRSDLSNFEIAIAKTEEDRLFKGREIKSIGEPIEPTEEETQVEDSAEMHNLLADLLSADSNHEKNLLKLQAEIESLQESIKRAERSIQEESKKIEARISQIDALMAQNEESKLSIDSSKKDIASLFEKIKSASEHLDSAKNSKPDNSNRIAEVKQAISNRDLAIEIKRKWNDFRAKTAEIKAKKNDYDHLTIRINELREKRSKIIAEALGEGFDFDFETSTIRKNGMIFDQLSQAEKILASCQILFKTNPKIRVVCVRDGSLLDSRSTADLVAICKESGFQLWIETVGSGNSEDAIVIEEGGLKL